MYLESENQELLELLSLVKAAEEDPSTGSHPIDDSPAAAAAAMKSTIAATPGTAVKTLNHPTPSSSTPFDQLEKALRGGQTPTPARALAAAGTAPLLGSIFASNTSPLNNTGSDYVGGIAIPGSVPPFPPQQQQHTPPLSEGYASHPRQGSVRPLSGPLTYTTAGPWPPERVAAQTLVDTPLGAGWGGAVWESTGGITPAHLATAAAAVADPRGTLTEPRRVGSYTLSHTLFSPVDRAGGAATPPTVGKAVLHLPGSTDGGGVGRLAEAYGYVEPSTHTGGARGVAGSGFVVIGSDDARHGGATGGVSASLAEAFTSAAADSVGRSPVTGGLGLGLGLNLALPQPPSLSMSAGLTQEVGLTSAPTPAPRSHGGAPHGPATPHQHRPGMRGLELAGVSHVDPGGLGPAVAPPRTRGGGAALCSPEARTVSPGRGRGLHQSPGTTLGGRPASATLPHPPHMSTAATAAATGAGLGVWGALRGVGGSGGGTARVRDLVEREPQPSLRPQPPSAKYATPQGGGGHPRGDSGSAGRAKLNHLTLPSPPRSFPNVHGHSPGVHHGGSGSGGGGGAVPCIRTQEVGPAMGLGKGVQATTTHLSSIAGRLAGEGGAAGVPPRRGHWQGSRAEWGVHGAMGAGGTPLASPPTTTTTAPAAGGVSLSPVAPLLLRAATAAGGAGGTGAMDAMVAAHVLTLCRDQHGCRQLQNLLTKEIFFPTTADNLESFPDRLREFEAAYATGSGSAGALSEYGGSSGGAGGFDSRRQGGGGNHNNRSPFDVSALTEAEKETNYHASLLIAVIVRAVQENFSLVMSDAYGNFLVQKIFDVAPSRERVSILAPSPMRGSQGERPPASSPHQSVHNPNGFCNNIIAIACSPHGTFALQRLIETIRTDEEEAFIFSAMFPPRSAHPPAPGAMIGGGAVGTASGSGHDAMMKLFTDANGGHVLGKMTAYLKSRYGRLAGHHSGAGGGGEEGFHPRGGGANAGRIFERLRHLYEFLLDHLFFICTHRQGCCVVQKCIDFFGDTAAVGDYPRGGGNSAPSLVAHNQTRAAAEAPVRCFDELAHRIIELTPELAVNPFGNYVVTHLIEVCFLKGSYSHVKAIFTHINRRIFFYCRNKFASNVVEKTLRHVSEDEVRAVCVNLMEVPTDTDGVSVTAVAPTADGRIRSKLELLALDPYGNYVVQTLLGTAPVDLLMHIPSTASDEEADRDSGRDGAGPRGAVAADEADAGSVGGACAQGTRPSAGRFMDLGRPAWASGPAQHREGRGRGGCPTGMLWQLQQVVPEIREKNLGKKIVTKMELAMLRVREHQHLD